MKKKIVIISFIFMIMFVFAWFNIIKPCEIKNNVSIYIAQDYGTLDEIYNTETFDNLISQYNGIKTTQIINDEKLVRTDGLLPSNNEKDYKRICIELKVKNRSIFEQKHFVASINMSEHSNILYTYDSMVSENVKPFKTGNVDVMWLEMYCGDMTNDEIAEYIKGLTIKVSYGNSVTGVKTESVKIRDVIEIRRKEVKSYEKIFKNLFKKVKDSKQCFSMYAWRCMFYVYNICTI